MRKGLLEVKTGLLWKVSVLKRLSGNLGILEEMGLLGKMIHKIGMDL